MQRRKLLALAGAPTSMLLAGCVLSEEDDRQSDSDGPSDDDSLAEILDHRLYNTGGYAVGVSGQIKNTSEEMMDTVWVWIDFLDENGEKFEETMDSTANLSAGEVWEFDGPFLGDASDRISDYDLESDVTNA